MKEIILLTLAIAILSSPVIAAEEKEGEFIYLFTASLGENLNLDKIVFKSMDQNNGELNLQISDEWTNTVMSNRKGWELALNEENGLLGLIVKDPSSLNKPKEENSYLFISTEDEIDPSIIKGRKAKLSLTSFSLKGESYELLIGPSSAFSWDSEGWQSSDFSSFFSDDSKFKTGLALFTEEDGEIYIKFVSKEPAFQPESDEDE